MIKAVLFDLFETLISEYQAGKRKADRTNRSEEELLGIPLARFKQEWSCRSAMRMKGRYASFHEVIREILEQSGISYPADGVELLFRQRVAEKRLAFSSIHAELLPLLDRLRNEGCKLGLVSNCTEEEVLGWGDSPLSSRFDDVVLSYSVGLAKPDVRIYELACERLGVSPQEAAFVGDGGSKELEGARLAGLMAFQAGWYVPPPFRQPHPGCPVLESPLQLFAYFG